MERVVLAAVQTSPVFLDQDATVDKAVRMIEKAGSDGARLVVFPETFVPAYPDWVWRSKPWDDGPAEWTARLIDQSVVVPSPATGALGKAAAAAGVYLSIGVNERDSIGSTVYNTQLYFGPDGLLGKHRKLMPTGGQRLLWGMVQRRRRRLSRGNTVIVGPEGQLLAGPLIDQEGIVMAEVDVSGARISRRQFDPMGHYARPDVFQLVVDTRSRPAAIFYGEPDR